jgi:LPXTG-motif cell wall-anchored protein
MKVFVTAAATLFAMPAFAGVNSAIFFQVPTLDEFGLVGLIAAIGIAAGLIVRRRKK